MKKAILCMAMAVAILPLVINDTAGAKAAKKQTIPEGKKLQILNCTSMTIMVHVSQMGPEKEKILSGGNRALFPAMPGYRPLIQIKAKQIKSWKTIYSQILNPLAGGQPIYWFKWNGVALEYGGKC